MVDAQDKLSAQVAVLGSLLIEPRLIGEALSKIKEEDFTNPKCRMVFCAIRALFTAGEKVDAALVRGKLGGRSGDGWDQYLLELMDLTPTAANIWEYAKLMREQARMSKGAELGQLITDACLGGDGEKLVAYLAQLNGLMVDRPGIRRMNMEEMLISFSERHTTPHEYITWNFPKLDKQLYTDLGDMVVLGGYPSAGKTALAVAFAYHQANQYRVGFYSLETNRYKLADRLISNMASIDMGSIKRGEIDEQQWERFARESDRIRVRKLELIEASGMSAQDIQADALANRYEVIYVDYLQLIEPESRRMNRAEQVSGISRDLQKLAHGNNILVVALSQLTRPETTKEGNAVEPTMSDLRESGQIEQDADAIMLLYLERPETPNESRRVLKIGKNKEGTRGRVYLVFDGQYQRFRESALDEPAPAKPRRREPEYKQASFYALPGAEPVPWEEKSPPEKPSSGQSDKKLPF